MSTFWLIYLSIGLFFVVLEHKLNMVDYEGATRRQLICGILQQTTHYFRIWLTYPLYLLEDALIIASNGKEEEE
jgi:hypothetical protein